MDALSRQAAEVWVMEGHSMNIDGTFDVAAEKDHPILLDKFESVKRRA